MPAAPPPTRKDSGKLPAKISRIKVTVDAPVTRPSIACKTVSIVFVFVMTTDTLRASATRKAGPVKSMTPLMKALAVACSTTRRLRSISRPRGPLLPTH